MEDPYKVFDIPNDNGKIIFDEFIEKLTLEYRELEQKEYLNKGEIKYKRVIERILREYKVYGEILKEAIINMYLQGKYQSLKSNCNNQKEIKELSKILSKISNQRKRINYKNQNLNDDELPKNKKDKFEERLKITKNYIDTKNEKIEDFYKKHPLVKKKILNTNYLKKINVDWEIDRYQTKYNILDYKDESKCTTKASALGKLRVLFKNKKGKRIAQDFPEIDIVKVDKIEENGMKDEYIVFVDLPKEGKIELEVYNGKVHFKDNAQTKINKNKEKFYANEVFSYAMLENSKNNSGYIGQIHKITNIYREREDMDFIDGLYKEALTKCNEKKGKMDKNTLSLNTALKLLGGYGVNNEKNR